SNNGIVYQPVTGFVALITTAINGHQFAIGLLHRAFYQRAITAVVVAHVFEDKLLAIKGLERPAVSTDLQFTVAVNKGLSLFRSGPAPVFAQCAHGNALLINGRYDPGHDQPADFR